MAKRTASGSWRSRTCTTSDPLGTPRLSSATIADVAATFAEFSGKSIVLGREVQGMVTADVRNLRMEQGGGPVPSAAPPAHDPPLPSSRLSGRPSGAVWGRISSTISARYLERSGGTTCCLAESDKGRSNPDCRPSLVTTAL